MVDFLPLAIAFIPLKTFYLFTFFFLTYIRNIPSARTFIIFTFVPRGKWAKQYELEANSINREIIFHANIVFVWHM